MTPRRAGLLLLAGLALLLTPAAFFTLRLPKQSALPPPAAAFPGLMPAQVGKITLTLPRFMQGVEEVVLLRDAAGNFTLPARAGFPADPEKITALLEAMAALQLREPRSDDPVYRGALGLQAPEALGRAIRVALFSPEGEILAQLLAGKPAPGSQGAGGAARFVRLEAAGKNWLAAGRLPIQARLQDWLALALPEEYGADTITALIRTPEAAPDASVRLEGRALNEARPALAIWFEDARPLPPSFRPHLNFAVLSRKGGREEVLWRFGAGLYQGGLWVAPLAPLPVGGAAREGWIFRLAPPAAAVLGARNFAPPARQ